MTEAEMIQAKEQQAAYKRAWYRKNKAKHNEAQQRYYLKLAREAARAAGQEEPTADDAEAIRKAANAYRRNYNRRNPEKVREAQRRYWLRKAQQDAGKV